MKDNINNIEMFWNDNPCGVDFINGELNKDFYLRYDRNKYEIENHIPNEIKKLDIIGKKVLEIGLGQGAESQLIIQNGGLYNGIDLTNESIKRVKKRFEIFGLRYESLSKMNAENMNFKDGEFDFVFSHGVIHHSPRINKIISEINRVLKPGGKIAIMVYHKNSINYQISIKLIRRLGIFLLYIPYMSKIVSKLTGEPLERLNKHKLNLKEEGLSYLKISNFIHKATDGPDNIFSSLFSENMLKEMFGNFKNVKVSKFYFNDRHFPILKNIISKRIKEKIASKWGWHIWIYGEK